MSVVLLIGNQIDKNEEDRGQTWGLNECNQVLIASGTVVLGHRYLCCTEIRWMEAKRGNNTNFVAEQV